jgi:hypothetical protein
MFSICDLEGAKSIILNFYFLFLDVQTRHFVGFSFSFFLLLDWKLEMIGKGNDLFFGFVLVRPWKMFIARFYRYV